MHLQGIIGNVAFSRIGLTPPQATRSWMSFLAPIGVTVLIIVPVSAALLSSEIEPVDRDEIDSVLDFEETERGVSAQRSSPSGDFATTVSDAPQEPVRRRRGFSPVLGDEEGSEGSAEADDDDDDDDDYDEDDFEEASREPRPPITPERRAEIVQSMIDNGRRVPFLTGVPGILERRRARREANRSDSSEEGDSPTADAVRNVGQGGAMLK